MLIHSGIVLVKYWFSVSDDEQERRFRARIEDPEKRWKLSPMDLEARVRWADYSRAKDDDVPLHRHEVVAVVGRQRRRQAARPAQLHHATCSRRSRTRTSRRRRSNLPPRRPDTYVRPPIDEQTFVPEVF